MISDTIANVNDSNLCEKSVNRDEMNSASAEKQHSVRDRSSRRPMAFSIWFNLPLPPF
jgi:hypothetical protein